MICLIIFQAFKFVHNESCVLVHPHSMPGMRRTRCTRHVLHVRPHELNGLVQRRHPCVRYDQKSRHIFSGFYLQKHNLSKQTQERTARSAMSQRQKGQRSHWSAHCWQRSEWLHGSSVTAGGIGSVDITWHVQTHQWAGFHSR